MPTKSNFGPEEKIAVDNYLASEPKITGNLHERMKLLLKLHDDLQAHLKSSSDRQLELILNQLHQAVLDLQTEVAYTTPAKPPYGDRPEGPRFNELCYAETE